MVSNSITYREYQQSDVKYIRDILENVILLNSGLPRENAHKFYESRGYSKKSYGFIKQVM